MGDVVTEFLDEERLSKEKYDKDDREKDRKKRKKNNYAPFLVGGIFVFLVIVVFFWRNMGNKNATNIKSSQAETETNAAVAAAAAAAQARLDAEEQHRAYLENLNQEKNAILGHLNANFEAAKKNKELFLQINEEADEESIEASFLLKDDKDTQRVKIVEENKALLEEKNKLVARLQEVENLLAQ